MTSKRWRARAPQRAFSGYRITRQVGSGDVKLAALTGMLPRWLGWNHFVLALISVLLLAAVTAAVLMATRRISRRDPLPLGPFLLVGALIGVLA